MCSQKINRLNILNLEISKILYSDLLNLIVKAIYKGEQITITYANASTINLTLKDPKFKNALGNIDYIHPDGIGVYLSSKFIYGANGFKNKITGSDFYTELIKLSKEKKYSFFFFGDKDKTLEKISVVNPDLKIKGFQNGFHYLNTDIIESINSSFADILLVGLGSPKQEEWIVQNRFMINPKVIIAVGDGIKVFAGTKKRGPKIFQKLALEWIVRLFFEPKRLWKRYIIGIPLFTFRIIKFKFSLKNT